MYLISFYPKFEELTDNEANIRLMEYRRWLELHGNYGKLFMWDINKITSADMKSEITGVRIYDDEIAMLFKLNFEV